MSYRLSKDKKGVEINLAEQIIIIIIMQVTEFPLRAEGLFNFSRQQQREFYLQK
jgi:hypothetical protein